MIGPLHAVRGSIEPSRHRLLTWLLFVQSGLFSLIGLLPSAWSAPPGLSNEQLRGRGFRVIEGRYLRLVTDLPAQAAVDELPAVFDLAYPDWCEFFARPNWRERSWQITGYLMLERDRFRAAGLLRPEVPEFLHGYAVGDELWLDEQPSDYYRRHLLLHEGTHAFMNHALGGGGPPWLVEGVAELLATHRWADGRLTLNHFPVAREEVLEWGRIRLIHEARQAGAGLDVSGVLHLGPTAHRETRAYAWSWGLASLLDGDPSIQAGFRSLPELAQRGLNDAEFYARTQPRDRMFDAWQVYLDELDFGYDRARAAIVFAPGDPLPAGGATATVRADRGWQSSRLKLSAGVEYQLTATGQCTLAQQPRPWISEPRGVSIRYYRGRPLGTLLAIVRPDETTGEVSPFLMPFVIGPAGTITARAGGTLYLRINDRPSELADNTGQYQVEVRAVRK